MDVTALAASADGLLVAAARTDNWLDVYDARMLARGPLRRCAHEREQDPRVAPTYGVVKAQWVEGRPWGEGLISGGVDGACLVCASWELGGGLMKRFRMHSFVGHEACGRGPAERRGPCAVRLRRCYVLSGRHLQTRNPYHRASICYPLAPGGI